MHREFMFIYNIHISTIYEYTEFALDWGCSVPICGGLCFPDVSEPLAEITSEFFCLEAFTEEGNLQCI